MYPPVSNDEITGIVNYLDLQLSAIRAAAVGLTDEQARLRPCRSAATDPTVATIEPPAPWDGIYDARPANARYYLVHQIEEFARHAGHADIIREQIDGMAVPAIALSQSGAPGNDYFQPYVPSPGTIGAT